MCHCNYYTIADTNLLQITISGKSVVEASLTLSFFHQTSVSGATQRRSPSLSSAIRFFLRFDLLHHRKCILIHMCFQIESILVRNLSV